MRQHFVATAVTVVVLWVDCSAALAEQLGHVDSSNIGVAVEDAVISSGLPEANLDVRLHIDELGQQLLNTTSDSDYPDLATAALAQEYMIFKFDFSSLPSGATAASRAWFDFSAWSTVKEGMPEEATHGRFKFYEITSGNGDWTDRHIDGENESTTPVTWNSLNGAFTELVDVFEDDADPPENTTGRPFGVLYPGLLVSNGGFDGANRIIEIPIDTINRLISGQSIGLAMGSVAPPAATRAGDYDGDHDIDGADLLVWQQQLGDSVLEGTGADGTGDGVIDEKDLVIWTANFGLPPLLPTEGVTNFSITTTENAFTHPLSSPTLNFDWSAPEPLPAAPEPSSLCLCLFSLLLISRAVRN